MHTKLCKTIPAQILKQQLLFPFKCNRRNAEHTEWFRHEVVVTPLTQPLRHHTVAVCPKAAVIIWKSWKARGEWVGGQHRQKTWKTAKARSSKSLAKWKTYFLICTSHCFKNYSLLSLHTHKQGPLAELGQGCPLRPASCF